MGLAPSPRPPCALAYGSALKAIVTGSEGFIGQALVRALQKRGAEVIGIDRKTGQEVKDIAKYLPDDVDVVFHLAAQTSVFNTDLLQIRKDNIDAFMDVVRACVCHPNLFFDKDSLSLRT